MTLTALIWGVSFVAQSVGMEYIGPHTFNAARMLIGGVALLPLVYATSRRQAAGKAMTAAPLKSIKRKKYTWQGGFWCGLALFGGCALQQMGMVSTAAGKAGFITAFYIVLVPLLGLLLHKPAGFLVWFSVFLALAGLYLLCVQEDLVIEKGDLLLVASSFFFACHILLVDHFAPKGNGIEISCIQFFVAGIVALCCAFIWETPSWTSLWAAWKPVCYAGFLSSGLGYTLQMIAQKHTKPVVASLLMSLESVFAVLAGWFLLNEVLSLQEWTGCLLVFGAVILAQLPGKNKEERQKTAIKKAP